MSTTLLSKDTYKAVNRIVKIGTKEVPPALSAPNQNEGNGNISPEASGGDIQTNTQPETNSVN